MNKHLQWLIFVFDSLSQTGNVIRILAQINLIKLTVTQGCG